MDPSETTRSTFTSGTIRNNTKFYEWLVGLTDGDGTFYFAKTNKGVWTFTFKIGQSNYNLRLLYYIKSNLGVGKVSVPKSKDNTAEFRIRNIQHIIMYILPIFDKYPLLTSKYFSYSLFKKAILIMNDSSLSKEEKDRHISLLKSQSLPENYISLAWQDVNLHSVQDALKIMSKSRLIGFTEATGNFILIKKNTGHIIHAFEMIHTTCFSTPGYNSQFDSIIFIAIANLINIKNPIFSLHYLSSEKMYVKKAQITDSKSISNIILFYYKTMKGLKSLEYRIWARSFNKGKNKTEISRLDYLEKIYKINYKFHLKLNKSCLCMSKAKGFNINTLLPSLLRRLASP